MRTFKVPSREKISNGSGLLEAKALYRETTVLQGVQWEMVP